MQVSDNELTGGDQPGAIASGRGRKMYYSISEVCAMTGIEPHILRYWEKEFSLLRPKKNSGGKRAYREKDIEAIVRIKRMLEEEGYTLQGAKSKLSDERREHRERRTGGGNATAVKRRKADAAGSGEVLTRRKSVPKINNDHGVNNNVSNNVINDTNNNGGNDSGNNHDDDNNKRGNDSALISSIRDELLGVLELLEP